MATYILLGTLTNEGAEKLRSHPEWIDQANRDLAAMGVTVIAQYAVLGPYDLVNIIEAPDNRTVVRVSAGLSSARQRADYHFASVTNRRFPDHSEVMTSRSGPVFFIASLRQTGLCLDRAASECGIFHRCIPLAAA